MKGAGGRAILAFLDQTTVTRALHTVSDPDDYAARPATVREDGFALHRDELRNGVHGIAAPVEAMGHVVASVSLIVPAQRGEVLLGHLDMLLRATKTISGNLESDR